MAISMVETLRGLESISDFDLENDTPKVIDNSLEWVKGSFSYNNLRLTFQQFKSSSLTVSILSVTFRYVTQKKFQKNKLLEALNSFNDEKPGIKAILKVNDDKSFGIAFSIELVCPDEIIGESIITPSLKILISGGVLLRQSLGRYGINIASNK